MIIGLTGRARSGKDTAFKLIHKNFSALDRPVGRLAIADKMKESAAAALGITVNQIQHMDTLKEFGEVTYSLKGEEMRTNTGREYLQWYGAEAHRKIFGDDFWIDQCLPMSLAQVHEGQIWVVTDVRFDNEAKRVCDLGGEVWRIKRPVADEVPSTHSSENPIASFRIAATISNNSTIDDFEDKLCDVVFRNAIDNPPMASAWPSKGRLF